MTTSTKPAAARFKFTANLDGDFDEWSNSDGSTDDRIECLGADENARRGWYERFAVTAETVEDAEAILRAWFDGEDVTVINIAAAK